MIGIGASMFAGLGQSVWDAWDRLERAAAARDQEPRAAKPKWPWPVGILFGVALVGATVLLGGWLQEFDFWLLVALGALATAMAIAVATLSGQVFMRRV